MQPFRDVVSAKGQRFVADALGVSQALVSHWLTRRKKITPDRAMAIEQALGVPAESLCDSVQWLRDPAGKLLGYVVAAESAPADAVQC
jgi:DNA-binding transcriptional regulator YdaS (Cro superfamily)